MALLTSQQLRAYHDAYQNVEVSFTRQVVQVLGLMPKEVHLKCQGELLPCVICSCSLRGAKVVASLRADSLARLKQANDLAALCFCFRRTGRSEPLRFFVPARVAGRAFCEPSNPLMVLLSLEYTQRPPDDLIGRLGELLEANVNARRRSEVRVDIHPASMKALGLQSKEALIHIAGKSLRCIIRDLSFSGARVLLAGASEGMVGAAAVLEPVFASGALQLPATLLRYEPVSGRPDIGALAMRLEADKTPMAYKLALNNYLRAHTA